MEDVIVHNLHTQAKQEIYELLQNKGYKPFFVEKPAELLSLLAAGEYTKIFLYVQNLSDIRFLQTIQSLYFHTEINLIIPPHLQEIIELLKNSDFKILNEITQVD